MKEKIINLLKKETVLCVSVVLAVISVFIITPDKEYINYIDFRTIGVLFSLMLVMAGLKNVNFFKTMGQLMLAGSKSLFGITMALVMMCFFGSMLITNDVALITFVPYTLVVLDMLGVRNEKNISITIVCMETIAANLGSMLTPVGNPQNLYLYGKSKMSMGEFVSVTFPYVLLTFIILVIWIAMWSGRNKIPVNIHRKKEDVHIVCKGKMIIYGLLFIVCMLAVLRIIHYAVALVIVLAVVPLLDKNSIKQVDYSLLFTFAALFVFIGNIGRITELSAWILKVMNNRETVISVVLSQCISNVPAAILLSGFTDNVRALIIGTNLGGLGTLIASMASLISYRQISNNLPEGKSGYFKKFTLSNLGFLVILLGLFVILTKI